MAQRLIFVYKVFSLFFDFNQILALSQFHQSCLRRSKVVTFFDLRLEIQSEMLGVLNLVFRAKLEVGILFVIFYYLEGFVVVFNFFILGLDDDLNFGELFVVENALLVLLIEFFSFGPKFFKELQLFRFF